MKKPLIPEQLSENDSTLLGRIIQDLRIGDEYFWYPERLVPYEHWVGHIPFAYWLVKVLQPRRLVELGTHRGNSYCAMCQAVSALQLDTVATAVDTWHGDVHMQVEEGLFEELSTYHDPRYGAFSTLLRAMFDEARACFSDSSIDLLHIDGTHTYDAVRKDFETWRSTLTDRGVVLFHDIEARQNNFGVWKLWEELSRDHPSFSFKHSFGLGVLGVGNNLPPELVTLFEMAKTPQLEALVRRLFSSRGSALVHSLKEQQGRLQIRHLEKIAGPEVLGHMAETARLREAALTRKLHRAEHAEGLLMQTLRQTEQNLAEQIVLREQETSVRQQTEAQLQDIVSSTMWRATGPLRNVSHNFPRARRLSRKAAKAAWWTVSGQLPQRLAARKAFVEAVSTEVARPSAVVPQYIFADANTVLQPAATGSVAVHLHVSSREAVADVAFRLSRIAAPFDVYVSVVERLNQPDFIEFVRTALPQAGKFTVRAVPDSAPEIAPLTVEFGTELTAYDVIGHFHAGAQADQQIDTVLRELALDSLLGSAGDVPAYASKVLHLVSPEVKLVVPQHHPELDAASHGDDKGSAWVRTILSRKDGNAQFDTPPVNLPAGVMFWARADALKDFLALPLTYKDFDAQPHADDGNVAHMLERLAVSLLADARGDIVQLHHAQYDVPADFAEEQEDYSTSIVHNDVKILAYYLPQFHPNPKNDEWHGKGFTEWTKVRAANPLFKGHYQQRVPHADLGYYHIEDDRILRQQADLMKKAGVHGLIFYHYWFSGELILEEPVKDLLANKDINMPFCFCWANENWTRRWDGSEREVLLGQNYSADDARAFIQYLIPFFQDERYITVDGRPMLHVYRPSSMVNPEEYIAIWAQECEKAGLKAPYLVATLAAGASSPEQFGMDAGADRVLYDWTNGAVKDITAAVHSYGDIAGRVFSYDEIAAHYEKEIPAGAFTRFPSIVPDWDNTARYGYRAHVLHGSTPERFQSWLEALVYRANVTLPEDRRFICVNAWNEWAEGAHLEPDVRSGYAYLNSVGRVLSDIPYHAVQGTRARADDAVMFVTHSWGGGTTGHVADLARVMRRKHIPTLMLVADTTNRSNIAVDMVDDSGSTRIASISTQSDPSVLSRLFDRYSVKLVHIHHTIDMPSNTADWLQLACLGAGVPYDVTLHDYFSVCPRIFLVNRYGDYCREPAENVCNACIAPDRPFGATSISDWRSKSYRLLRHARQRFVPDIDVANRMNRYFPDLKFTVRPHPEKKRDNAAIERLQKRASRPAGEKRIQNILLLGHLNVHKGEDVIFDCAQLASGMNLPLRFSILGDVIRVQDFKTLANVNILGRYDNNHVTEKIIESGADIIFLSSICPETYSYALSEALTAGLYPVAFDIGAIASRIKSLEWGTVLPIQLQQDPEGLAKALIAIRPTPPSQKVFDFLKGHDYQDVMNEYYDFDLAEAAVSN
ncbi:glycoside hydrolase family 99-like domain-containing protein [Aureimonas fodinaquatilis]|uniref:glycoside hydrolase family 99-like domain-containing protein n=1 Tax=Aureimonas fodinaquatilis TaxID=2565783 RepID=UPI00165DC9BF|nr:glycoside hydrolase family 99-like domain-containing protein [Aureimonas fodinaquatilis]